MLLCDHRWRFSHRTPPVEGGCSQPSKIVCIKGCGSHFTTRCDSARSKVCTYCAELKRGDIAAVGRSGWMDNPQDRGVFLTLTAPGFSWDVSQCTHTPGVPCSGTIGCQTDPTSLAIWHNALPLAWSHFMTELRRLLNPGVDFNSSPATWPVVVEFFKTYEPQSRGALHIHALMRVVGVVSAKRFEAAVRLARARTGFGPQVKAVWIDLSNSGQIANVAAYVSSYAGKSADSLPDVERLSIATGEVTHGGLRAWSASRRWGITMLAVRLKRSSWYASGGLTPDGGASGAGAAGALDPYENCYATAPPGVSFLGLLIPALRALLPM